MLLLSNCFDIDSDFATEYTYHRKSVVEFLLWIL